MRYNGNRARCKIKSCNDWDATSENKEWQINLTHRLSANRRLIWNCPSKGEKNPYKERKQNRFDRYNSHIFQRRKLIQIPIRYITLAVYCIQELLRCVFKYLMGKTRLIRHLQRRNVEIRWIILGIAHVSMTSLTRSPGL